MSSSPDIEEFVKYVSGNIKYIEGIQEIGDNIKEIITDSIKNITVNTTRDDIGGITNKNVGGIMQILNTNPNIVVDRIINFIDRIIEINTEFVQGNKEFIVRITQCIIGNKSLVFGLTDKMNKQIEDISENITRNTSEIADNNNQITKQKNNSSLFGNNNIEESLKSIMPEIMKHVSGNTNTKCIENIQEIDNNIQEIIARSITTVAVNNVKNIGSVIKVNEGITNSNIGGRIMNIQDTVNQNTDGDGVVANCKGGIVKIIKVTNENIEDNKGNTVSTIEHIDGVNDQIIELKDQINKQHKKVNRLEKFVYLMMAVILFFLFLLLFPIHHYDGMSYCSGK